MSGIAVTTTINGDDVEFLCQPDETLLDVLRNRLGLMGAKEGCGTGDCEACSTMMDGRVVCSCLVLGAEAEGQQEKQRVLAAICAKLVGRCRWLQSHHRQPESDR